ncbi:MAG: glycosyltransferase [Deferrisomatales bacterium]|nr:glycosyltransferase [Deferrisomatales bacterium]
MKILHVLDHSLPLHSGYTFRSRNIFQCQQAVDLEPVVVTSPKHEASLGGAAPAVEQIDGVRYHRTGAQDGPSLPFLGERRLMALLERNIERIARAERAAVLHAHSPVLNALPALRVGKRLGLPVVYEIRAFWEDAAVDHGTYGEWGAKYRLVRWLETRACRSADRVVTICEGLRADLAARGIPEGKTTVVPNAVNPEEFRPVARDPDLARKWGLDGGPVIGFLGSFYHYEGLDLLIEAVARLVAGTQHSALSTQHSEPSTQHSAPSTQHRSRSSQHLGIKLLLVGGGRMEGALRAQAEHLGIADHVVFTGRLPHEQMPAMYSLVDVLCFPRKSMRLTELVTPLKPLETMAMGKPIVASDVGGHKELIQDGETGLLFRAGDSASLADHLHRLLTDQDLRRRLGEQGRTWVSQHRTWGDNGGRYRALYQGLLPR